MVRIFLRASSCLQNIRLDAQADSSFFVVITTNAIIVDSFAGVNGSSRDPREAP
jgi:hypothetical protein